VRTGEWVRRGYGKSGVRVVQQHYGMRIVCAGCAAWIDTVDRKDARRQWLQIAAWVGLLLVIRYLLS
jgi:hypothetical protein